MINSETECGVSIHEDGGGLVCTSPDRGSGLVAEEKPTRNGERERKKERVRAGERKIEKERRSDRCPVD